MVNPYLLSNLNCLSTKEELQRRIESMENSAASVLCSLSTSQMLQKSFMEDIVGVVALLGSVQRPKLSRSYNLFHLLSFFIIRSLT